MVHRQHCVGTLQMGCGEQGVRGQRALQAHAVFSQSFERRLDHLDLFATQVTALAGMRVESADQYPRPVDRKPRTQLGIQHAQDAVQERRCDRIGHCAQWQVCGGKRDPQPGAGQHHHRVTTASCGEKLGVAGEGDPGVVDDSLVHRCGDHRGEPPLQAAVDGADKGVEDIAGVADVQDTWFAGCRQGYHIDIQPAGRRWHRGGLRADGLQCERQAEPCGALQQQVRVADHHQRYRPCALCDRHTQVGTDSGGLSGGQGEGVGGHLSC